MVRILLIVLCVISLNGCAANHIKKVSGKVTMNGEPIEEIALTFLPPPDNLNQGSFFAVTKEDGTFEYNHDLKGPRVLPGTFTVTFADARMQRSQQELHEMMGDPAKLKEMLKASRLPKKYTDSANGIQVEVGTGNIDVGELKLTNQ